MAEQLRISPQFIVKQAQDLAQKIPEAIAQAGQSVAPMLPASARVLVDRLTRFVLTTTKKTAARITQ